MATDGPSGPITISILSFTLDNHLTAAVVVASGPQKNSVFFGMLLSEAESNLGVF